MVERFGSYYLLHKIATGGMAEIYLARHVNSPATSMPVVIKKILSKYSHDLAFIQMFLAEARIICNINHQNIVKIYDFDKSGDIYYIAMEYVFGNNLGALQKSYVDRKLKFSVETVLEISFAVLCGLNHAHNTRDRNGVFLNVIHLDVNPNNILLSYNNEIKIVDFGIASAKYTKLLKNNLGAVQGTVAYLSPEQCREEEVDRRSDIFSFGIIMYELLTGKYLYKDLPNDAARINAILNEPVPNIKEYNPDVPDELIAIVEKALKKNRDERYATAAEMLDDLHKFQYRLEYNPDSESISQILKKSFPSHFLKMNKLLEKAQADYMMDELFKDIEELEDLDISKVMQIDMTKKEEEHPADETPENGKNFLYILSGVVVALAVIAVMIFVFSREDDSIESKVLLFSNPPEAEVYVNGEDTGRKTPAEIFLKVGKSYILEFRKDNFEGGINYKVKKEENQINLLLKSNGEQ